jgi:hypothetical protein
MGYIHWPMVVAGLKTSLREDDCVPIDSVPRFFNKLTISGAS